jgi:hypothetical protein
VLSPTQPLFSLFISLPCRSKPISLNTPAQLRDDALSGNHIGFPS